MEVDRKLFRNWWPISKEVRTLLFLQRCQESGKWGPSQERKAWRKEKPLAECQSLGAVASSGTVLAEAGRAVWGQENSHTRSLQGRRCGDHYLLLGCWDVEDGCERDWDAETWMFMAEWVGKPLLTVCIALGGSEHHYLQNTSNWYS